MLIQSWPCNRKSVNTVDPSCLCSCSSQVLKRLNQEGNVLQQLDSLRRENKELACKATAQGMAQQQLQRALQRLSTENEQLAEMIKAQAARPRPQLQSVGVQAGGARGHV